MASSQHDNNCINCLHRHEKSIFQSCADCVKNSKKADQFPGWQPVKPAEAAP